MFTFTDEQQYVVSESSKNILLLARAGSGKTFTVANKIAKAVEGGLAPCDVLCLTFTVKGAQEIKDDVAKYCGKEGVNVFTIHGFCFHLIKEHLVSSGAFREPHIADEVDVGELLTNLLISYAEDGDYTLSDGLPLLPERQLSKIMSQIKHERDLLGFAYSSEEGFGATVDHLFETSSSFSSLFSVRKTGVKVTDYSLIDLLKKKGNRFCLDYQRRLRASDLLDFDDLIFLAKELLYSNEYQKYPYKLIIVDEMQDTSMLEYEVARCFFGGAHVLMCGDPYQTIYSWRGSQPALIMEDFKKSFGAVEVTLSGNRRSSKLITYAGRYYLSESFEGRVSRPQPIDLSGEQKIDVVSCFDSQDEADYIYNLIKNYQGDRSGICVMARSNRYIASLYKYFERKNLSYGGEAIPFFTADSDFQFYKKPVVKDFLSFFRLLVNPNDVASFSRIAEKYVRGVGKETISKIKDFGAYGLSLSSFLSEDSYLHGDPYFELMSAYKSKNTVIYDLETTGLDLEGDEMIQISAKKLTGEEFNRFVIPRREISEKALLTHGYSLDAIKANGGKDASEVLAEFTEFAKGSVLIGHNSSSFDDVILRRQLKENGLELDCKGFFDTITLAQTVLPRLKNYKLSVCAEHFGIVNERAHDAMSDVRTTVGLFERLMEEFYLPMTGQRERIIESIKNKFAGFYSDFSKMKGMLARGDIMSLIRLIDLNYGLLKKNPRRSDRESANDLYRALKYIEGGKDRELMLRAFLSDTALSGSQLDVIIKKHGKIPLITVHQSKGCEFDLVILAGAGENELPSYGAKQSGSEEEEKRIFYVALSRARKKFIITYPSKTVHGQNVYERLPSPYIKRLPQSAVSFISTDTKWS